MLGVRVAFKLRGVKWRVVDVGGQAGIRAHMVLSIKHSSQCPYQKEAFGKMCRPQKQQQLNYFKTLALEKVYLMLPPHPNPSLGLTHPCLM